MHVGTRWATTRARMAALGSINTTLMDRLMLGVDVRVIRFSKPRKISQIHHNTHSKTRRRLLIDDAFLFSFFDLD